MSRPDDGLDAGLTLRDALRWEGLVSVAPLLVSTLEYRELLRWILTMALRVVDAEACTLALAHPDGHALDYAVVLGEREDAVRQFPVRPGEDSILGWVAKHGKPIVTNDVVRHPLWNREVAAKIGFETRAIVCVPLSIKGQIIGALEVINKREGTGFSDEDVQILTAFASIASVCAENGRLYEWLGQRAERAEGELLALVRELSRRQAEHDAVISTMGDGLILLDAERRAVEINRTAELLLGVRREEVLGLRWGESALASGPLRDVIAAVEQASDAAYEGTIAAPGERTVTCRVSPFRDGAGAPLGLVIVLSDVTALAAVSRLKTEFVAYVSHELRAPLTCMRGFADILTSPEAATLPEGEAQEFLQIIRGEADRCLRLISRLLNVSRIESGRGLELFPVPLDMVALAHRAVEASQALSSKHTLRIEAEEPLPEVEADQDQIEEVLVNLLSNAVKYSPAGGDVRVWIGAEGPGLHVSVSDPGVGMTAEQMARLFSRYERVRGDTAIAGTGLGLYVSKGIIDAHGGRIWVESQPGRGSTFHFTLSPHPPSR